MKNILITGKNSYIGNAVRHRLEENPTEYTVTTIDLKDPSWQQHDFSAYDVVFHVAGIAHVPFKTNTANSIYFRINRDLTKEVGIKSKIDGVSLFIFMSSMIVYGASKIGRDRITKETIPSPTDEYGLSKLQAENELERLESDNFKVAIIRAPMIYGKNSKGNYPTLVKLARTTPIFPWFKNERSMLYIGNLCEQVKLIIDHENEGIYYPQNKELVCTSNMVKEISKIHNHRIYFPTLFNWTIKAASRLNVGIVKKVFGNLAYDPSISEYEDGNYQLYSFEDSLKLTEEYR